MQRFYTIPITLCTTIRIQNQVILKLALREFVVHQAAIEGRLKLIKYLHRQGIKLNLTDRDGQTPILLAALKEHWNIVYYLHAKIGHKKEKSRKIENSLHWSTIGKHFSRIL